MIRRSTIFTPLVAIALGFGLFRLTYEVQTLEGELARVNRAVVAEREAAHVLRAEWSYMNEPTRLEALTKKHLCLRATQDGRIRTVAEIPARPDAPIATGMSQSRCRPRCRNRGMLRYSSSPRTSTAPTIAYEAGIGNPRM